MKVTFTKEYRDSETGKTHHAGEQAELSDEQARKAIQEGAAKETGGSQQQPGQKQSGR